MSDIETLIAEAKKWVGYVEKRSAKELDSFTENAGSANYTRFNRDYEKATGDAFAQPEQWCGIFVSMCFVYAFGLNEARRLLCGALYKYTPSGADAFRRKGQYIRRGQGTPRKGDVIFFWSAEKKRIAHTGIVTKVTNGKVYTVEGNTSAVKALVTNGGGVAEKSYALTSTYIDGYGRPDYAAEGGKTDVRLAQIALIANGFSCGPCGTDGILGSDTKKAILNYQRTNGLTADGTLNAETLGKLLPEVTFNGDCWIRTRPDRSAAEVGVAKKGSVMTGNGMTENGWIGVIHKDVCRWVSGKYAHMKEA